MDAIEEEFIVDAGIKLLRTGKDGEGSLHEKSQSNTSHETAGIKKPARVELAFYLAHQPGIGGRWSPNGERVFPGRWAARHDDTSLAGAGLVAPGGQGAARLLLGTLVGQM